MSVMGGGKFANGAKSAAFGYLVGSAIGVYGEYQEYMQGPPIEVEIPLSNNIGPLLGPAITATVTVARTFGTFAVGKLAQWRASLTVAKSGGNAVVRTTRAGDKAIRTTRPDGSIIDITPQRVKAFVPNTHPKAPSGALNRVKFDNAIPGSKGFKRLPTQQELDILKNVK